MELNGGGFRLPLAVAFSDSNEYFKKLKQSSFNDIQLINAKLEYKGTSPEFTFGDMQEELEANIFEMSKGEVRGPIEIADLDCQGRNLSK